MSDALNVRKQNLALGDPVIIADSENSNTIANATFEDLTESTGGASEYPPAYFREERVALGTLSRNADGEVQSGPVEWLPDYSAGTLTIHNLDEGRVSEYSLTHTASAQSRRVRVTYTDNSYTVDIGAGLSKPGALGRFLFSLETPRAAAKAQEAEDSASASAASAAEAQTARTAAETARTGAETAQSAAADSATAASQSATLTAFSSITAQNAASGAITARNTAQQYRDEAFQAVSAGVPNVYVTKAAADTAASGLSDGTVVRVFQDETKAGAGTLYTVASGALTFVQRVPDILASPTLTAAAALPLLVGDRVRVDAPGRVYTVESAVPAWSFDGASADPDGVTVRAAGSNFLVAPRGGSLDLALYGMQTDGSNDEGTKLKQAFRASKALDRPLRFEGGASYRCSETLETSGVPEPDFNGAHVLFAGSGRFLESGTPSTAQALTADASAGSFTVSVPTGIATEIAAEITRRGRALLVLDSKREAGRDESEAGGTLGEICAVVSAPSGNTVTLARPLTHSYFTADAAEVFTVTAADRRWSTYRARHISATGVGVQFFYCDAGTVNVDIADARSAGAPMRYCYGLTVRGVVSGSNRSGAGYAGSFENCCTDCTYEGLIALDARHAVTSGFAPGPTSAINCVVRGAVGSGTQEAVFDQHAGYSEITFEGCTACGTAPSFTTEGGIQRIVNCTSTGASSAVSNDGTLVAELSLIDGLVVTNPTGGDIAIPGPSKEINWRGIVSSRSSEVSDYALQIVRPVEKWSFGRNIIDDQPVLWLRTGGDSYTYAAYSAGTTYTRGDWVQDGGTPYQSLRVNNTGNTPASSPDFWMPLTLPGTLSMSGSSRVSSQARAFLLQGHPSLKRVHLRYDLSGYTLPVEIKQDLDELIIDGGEQGLVIDGFASLVLVNGVYTVGRVIFRNLTVPSVASVSTSELLQVSGGGTVDQVVVTHCDLAQMNRHVYANGGTINQAVYGANRLRNAFNASGVGATADQGGNYVVS